MNKVILMGRLVRDPNFRTSPRGKGYAIFTIAADKNLSKDKKSEFEKQGKATADFIRVIAWGSLAELTAKFLKKGFRVLVEGSIQTGSYQDMDGKTIYTVDILANKLELIDWPSKNKVSEKEQIEASNNDFENNDYFEPIGDDESIPF